MFGHCKLNQIHPHKWLEGNLRLTKEQKKGRDVERKSIKKVIEIGREEKEKKRKEWKEERTLYILQI